MKIEFENLPDKQLSYPKHQFDKTEEIIIEAEIDKLLKKKAIEECILDPEGFISGVFTRPKKDGSRRMILNLKKLNQYVKYKHFKMESVQHVINCLKPNMYMASVDLKDAFYSVPVAKKHQKYLMFIFKDKTYKFVTMPNGYGPAMRLFTKILKVPFSHTRTIGLISVIFVDDSLLFGEDAAQCNHNVNTTISILRQLGFTIHVDKSQLEPTQVIVFLGFKFDSINMTIEVTQEKKEGIKSCCKNAMENSCITIRELAKIIGKLVATFPAVTFGKMHYRELEKEKIQALKRFKGNFEEKIYLSEKARKDLNWWYNNITSSIEYIHKPEVDKVVHTDASLIGWGAR